MMDNKNDKTTPKNRNSKRDCCVNITATLVIAISVIILLSCCKMFCETCTQAPLHKISDHRWLQLRDSIYQSGEMIDSVFIQKYFLTKSIKVKNKISQVEEDAFIFDKQALDKVIENQTELIKRQDRLADDLRQETNNVINKVNGWLAFWIGIITIIGVFVPVALQFKLYRETRDRDQERNSEYKKKFNGLKKEYSKELNYFRKEIQHIEFTTHIRDFQALVDCPGLKEAVKRNEIIEKSLKEIIQQFSSLLKTYKSSSDATHKLLYNERCDSYHLSIAIVQIASVMSLLKQLSPRRIRRVNHILTESYRLVDLINSSMADWEMVKCKLDTYERDLSQITVL